MENSSLRSFTKLVAWQKCRILRKAISKLARQFPPEEKFRLTDQIIRSSRGPCANIAEGYGRFHEKDNARFCRMARGSLYETMDHLSLAFDEEFISKEELKAYWAMAEEAVRGSEWVPSLPEQILANKQYRIGPARILWH
jgi:four helix bundle protein